MAASNKKGGKALTFWGILAGAAVGAAVALVYSPSTGEKNRRHLVQYVSNRVSSVGRKVGIGGGAQAQTDGARP